MKPFVELFRFGACCAAFFFMSAGTVVAQATGDDLSNLDCERGFSPCVTHVASEGVDTSDCGTEFRPCRTISRALEIARQQTLDPLIRVGPGIYGDLNGNGILGEHGEEWGDQECNCMLHLDLDVLLVSREPGYASVIIDASSTTMTAVRLSADNARLGAISWGRFGPSANRGFTVRGSRTEGVAAILADVPSMAKVKGNLVLAEGIGIWGRNVFIANNHVVGGTPGIQASNAEVNRNVVHLANGDGIVATNSLVIGNSVIASSGAGVVASGLPLSRVSRNSLSGNRGPGLLVTNDADQPTTMFVKDNSFLDNDNVGGLGCGLVNDSAAKINAYLNYWGAVGAPDVACDIAGGRTVTQPEHEVPQVSVPTRYIGLSGTPDSAQN